MSDPALTALLKELAAAPRAAEGWDRAFAPGEVIGRFELVRELHRDELGVVYEARDRELGRPVAFKAVWPGQAATPEAAEHLVREAEVIARLTHPNLVTLYDVGKCVHGPYLVLELLRGATLKDRLAHGPLPLGEALRVALQVASGLAHGHGLGIPHRAVKPSNVFLCEGGQVKVLDFGIAHAFGHGPSAADAPYAAPEQWRGAPQDARGDVYALGVMLHQMIAGQLPFGPAPRLPDSRRRAPTLVAPDAPGLAPLLERMLSADPAARPADAAEVVAALIAVQDQRPRTHSTTSTVWLRPRRRRWKVVAALLGAGVVAGAAVAALLLGRGEPGAPRGGPPCVAVLPFTTLSSSQDDVYFADGVHGELITQLAKIGGLRVIARSSVQPYREGARDLKAIARALNAGTIMEGSVQRAGDRVRIAAQLVDPRTGQELWADRFDRRAADVFSIQTEVALEIARILGARLTASERELVGREPTRDREAHDLYLRGLYYWQRSWGVDADNRMAKELVDRAVARDPAFALAHALLAQVATELDDCPAAREHADRALRLEPDLPEAHAALGEILRACDHDMRGGLREYAVAARGAPGDAGIRVGIGWFRTQLGESEQGLEDFRTALALDPRSYLVAIEVARTLAWNRYFDEAASACARAQELSPADIDALTLCALIPVWRSGDLTRARLALDELPRDQTFGRNAASTVRLLLELFPDKTLELTRARALPDPFAPGVPLAFVEARAQTALGHAAEARAAYAAALPEIERRTRATPRLALWASTQHLLLAHVYAGLGRGEDAMAEVRATLENEPLEARRARLAPDLADVTLLAGRRAEAIQLLAGALRRPDGRITPASLRVDPRFAALRGDPAFEALLASGAGAPRR